MGIWFATLFAFKLPINSPSSAIIESIPNHQSMTVWFAASTAKDQGRLQQIIWSAEKAIGCDLPSHPDLFHSRTSKRAGRIIADPSHPGHHLFPSSKRVRSIKTKTWRHLTSFFPTAVGLTNKPPAPHWLWDPRTQCTAVCTLVCILIYSTHHSKCTSFIAILLTLSLAQYAHTVILFWLFVCLTMTLIFILFMNILSVPCSEITKSMSCIWECTWQYK